MSELEFSLNMISIKDDTWATIPIAPSMSLESDETEYDSRSESESSSPVFSSVEGSGDSSETSSDDEDRSDDLWEVATKLTQKRLDGTTDDHIIRRFHADVDNVRIQIPTAHILGKKDPYYQQGRELKRLCETRWSTTYEHSDGHIVPRNTEVNKQIAAAIEKALAAIDISFR